MWPKKLTGYIHISSNLEVLLHVTPMFCVNINMSIKVQHCVAGDANTNAKNSLELLATFASSLIQC